MEENGIPHGPVTHTFMICGFAQGFHFKEAISLFEEMKENGMKISARPYNTIAFAYTKTKDYIQVTNLQI